MYAFVRHFSHFKNIEKFVWENEYWKKDDYFGMGYPVQIISVLLLILRKIMDNIVRKARGVFTMIENYRLASHNEYMIHKRTLGQCLIDIIN